MKFIDLLKPHNDIPSNYEIFENNEEFSKVILEKEKEKPEGILRRNNIKIKLVTPTSFGTQIDFAKQYNEKEITDLLKDFNIKLKGKSVFIIE